MQEKTCLQLSEWLYNSLYQHRRYLRNVAHTNPNIPSNLYWTKIWCIFLEEQSQGPTPKVTCSTERKSSFPFPQFLQSQIPQFHQSTWSPVPQSPKPPVSHFPSPPVIHSLSFKSLSHPVSKFTIPRPSSKVPKSPSAVSKSPSLPVFQFSSFSVDLDY